MKTIFLYCFIITIWLIIVFDDLISKLPSVNSKYILWTRENVSYLSACIQISDQSIDVFGRKQIQIPEPVCLFSQIRVVWMPTEVIRRHVPCVHLLGSLICMSSCWWTIQASRKILESTPEIGIDVMIN